ncbi:MAG: lamin tail domain-containing protein [Chloroflexales bacterium]
MTDATALAATATAVAAIKINDVVCRDPNYPSDSEFIELRNDSSAQVILTGWRVVNASRSNVFYTFPTYTTRIGPDVYVAVYSGIGVDVPSDDTFYWGRTDQLWFVGDKVELRDPSNRLINSYTVLAASC